MYVIIGHTRGDDLIGSQAKSLFASADRSTCEAKLASIQQERDAWLAAHEHEVPWWQRCSIYHRFEIVETPSNASEPDWFNPNRS